MLKLMLITCLTLLRPLEVAAQESSLVFNPNKDSADTAMALGDAKQLQVLVDQASDPVSRELISAYKARTELRLDASNNHASRCAALAGKDLRAYYHSSVRCRLLIAGNALVEGDYPKWSSLMNSSVDDASRLIRTLIQKEAPGAYADDVKIFLPGTVSLPNLPGPSAVFSRPATGSYIDRVVAQKVDGLSAVVREPFFVKVKVNGQDAVFAIDTGASATVIGGDTAQSLGLDKLVPVGRATYDLVLLGKQLSTTFARIKTLQVGGFSVSGATVLVAKDRDVLNVIGLDVIKRMGGIRFSSNGLKFVDTINCHGTLSLASDLVATNKSMVASVNVMASQKLVDIDTGNSAFLTAYGAASSPPGTQVTVNGISGIINSSKSPNPLGAKYNLGNAILDSFDMVVDLDKGKFCLEPKSLRQ